MPEYVRVPKADWISILDAVRFKTGKTSELLSGIVSSEIYGISTGVPIRNQDKTVTENGEYTFDEGYTGLGIVTVDVPDPDIPNPVIQPLYVTENGMYNPPEGVDGYSPITVNVAGGGDSQPEVNDGVARLIVMKFDSDTYADETSYSGESFVLLDVYPQANGTVNVTYGGLTKTITDTSGAEEPEPQQVFFGTYNGVSDNVETPLGGMLTIEGDYYAFAAGAFTPYKDGTAWCDCILHICSFGNANRIPRSSFPMNYSLAYVRIPDSITYIGTYAFAEPVIGTKQRKVIEMLSETPPILEDAYVFPATGWGASGNVSQIIVPVGCAEVYKTAKYWSNYADYITEAEV